MTRTRLQTHATVFDSAPPHYPVLALGAGAVIAGTVLGLLGMPGASLLFLASLVTLLAYDVRPRRGPRRGSIECHPSSVRIEGVGTLKARDIVGATTARHDGSVSLVLARKRRAGAPIILDLPDDAALASVSKSLGLGHHGFGEVSAVLKASPADVYGLISGIVALPLLVGLMLTDSYTMVEPLRAFATLAVCSCMFAGLLRLGSVAPKIVLTQGGVYLGTRHIAFPSVAGGTFVPFHAIENIAVSNGRLEITVRLEAHEGHTTKLTIPVSSSQWMRKGMSEQELQRIMAQVRAAADRAHGNFVMKHEPEALAGQLRRAPTESMREWLARIDTLGVGTVGYRTAQIDVAELWTILEDPEAEADLRSASARLLSRIAPEDARTRVADVLETVRDGDVRARIAASVDDDALEEQETEEQHAATKGAG